MRSVLVQALVLIFACGPVIVLADQAIDISHDAASRAMQLLTPTTLREYCAPCDEKGWTPLQVQSVKMLPGDGPKYMQIAINGDPIDLAYTYVKHNGKWTNVAMLLGLQVVSVPKILPDSLPMLDSRSNN